MGEFKGFIGNVYLSGPMDGLSFDTHDEEKSMAIWRYRAERYFGDHGICIINPMREASVITDPWIVEQDKLAIWKHSDAILANVSQIGTIGVEGKPVMGIGTIMEIIYAAENRVPVAIFDTGRVHEDWSVWMREHASVRIFKTQLEAQQWVVSINKRKLRPENYS